MFVAVSSCDSILMLIAFEPSICQQDFSFTFFGWVFISLSASQILQNNYN